MARPRIDVEVMKGRLLEEAERMLSETQGRRLVLSEISARVGISQPYAHRFFPRKTDLVRELAARWFAEIEAESSNIAALDLPPWERLERWLLTLLSLKRDRYDADPQLFDAYLELAADHVEIVADHTAKLNHDLKLILRDLVPPSALEKTVEVVEDATMPFRVPINISRFRRRATDARAKAVLNLLFVGIEALKAQGSGPAHRLP